MGKDHIYKKNVLLVGDYRSVNNYGAIATTEALLCLIDQCNSVNELKTIGFYMVNGIERTVRGAEIKKYIKDFLSYLKILNPILKIQKKMKINKSAGDEIPKKLTEYNVFLERVKKGDILTCESELIKWADIVLVNGEGNIVGGTDKNGNYRRGGRYLLFLAYVIKKLYAKPCYIINHTVDPQNNEIQEIICAIYPMMDGIYVREQLSASILHRWGLRGYRYIPDALWSYNFHSDKYVAKPDVLKKFDDTESYICIGDSSGLYNPYTKVEWDIVAFYTELIRKLKKICSKIIFIDGFGRGNPDINTVVEKNNIPVVHIENCNYHELYYVLKNADIFISGRWHTSIISLLAHTPILLWGADSHKTRSLYKEIDYKYAFFELENLPKNIDRIVQETAKVCTDNHDLIWSKVEELKEKSKLNTNMLYLA